MPGRPAARAGARQLDVLADARGSARAAPARPRARCADGRSPAGRSRSDPRASRRAPARAPPATARAPAPARDPSTPARWAAHPPAVVTIVPGERLAELAGELLAALELAVVGVQRAAAALRGRGARAPAPARGAAADLRIEHALEAAEHQRSPARRRPAPSRAWRRTSPIERTRRRRLTAHSSGRSFHGRRRPRHCVVAPLLEQRAVLHARRGTPARRRDSPGRTTTPRCTVGSSSGSVPFSSARMRLMRPRGEDVSTPSGRTSGTPAGRSRRRCSGRAAPG